MAQRVPCVSSPSPDQFVQLVDKLRKRGALRISWGTFAAEFLGVDTGDAPRSPAQALNDEQHRRLLELEERYARDEELGNV